MLRSCPAAGDILLSVEFQKDLNWFASNGIYIIQDDTRVPVTLHVEVCSMGARAICSSEAFHTKFPISIIKQGHTSCHLDALNSVAALWHQGKLIHLYSDSEPAVMIFQAGKCCSAFIQACGHQLHGSSVPSAMSHLVCHIYHVSCSHHHSVCWAAGTQAHVTKLRLSSSTFRGFWGFI